MTTTQTEPKNKQSLHALRAGAILAAIAGLVQAGLGGSLISGGDPGLHSTVAMMTIFATAVAAIAGVIWGRAGGNRGVGFHAIGMFAIAVIQFGLGEMGAGIGHIVLGILFVIGAVALAVLSIRKPYARA